MLSCMHNGRVATGVAGAAGQKYTLLNMALPIEVYLKIVLDIYYELEGENLEDIKFLCRAFLPADELKDIKNFKELALKLEEKKVFSEHNLQQLERLLGEINRCDLVQMVQETKARYVNAQGQPLHRASCKPGPLPHGGALPVDASNLAGLESLDLEIDDSSPVVETDSPEETLGDYCHPPEKDIIILFSQKSEQSKLIQRLKTEFSSNPLKKGIILTKSDQETKSLYHAIDSSKELCNRRFIVRPEKILKSFDHQTLAKFNAGLERCNLLIATDALLKDQIELCECQFLFRYNLVKKEMGTIQILARSQESCINCYLMIYENSQEHNQEIKNRKKFEANE